VGAIPVLVKPFDHHSNYLNAKEWRNYPGPVLGSWDELAEYMETLYPTARELSIPQKHRLDALQAFNNSILFSNYCTCKITDRHTAFVSFEIS